MVLIMLFLILVCPRTIRSGRGVPFRDTIRSSSGWATMGSA